MAYIIGITGSIATGKTTVSNYLIEKGYQVIDSDVLAYEALTTDLYCIQQVKKQFPEVFKNNQIDRSQLGEIIFNNPKRKEELNRIVHPYVISRLKKIKNSKIDQSDILFFDIPLLFEIGLEYLCNQVWVVYTPYFLQLERLIKRNNLSEEEAIARIRSQMCIDDKVKKADKLLDNQKGINVLQQQIEELLKELNNGING
jgi:dephospho-CoA kinase